MNNIDIKVEHHICTGGLVILRFVVGEELVHEEEIGYIFTGVGKFYNKIKNKKNYHIGDTPYVVNIEVINVFDERVGVLLNDLKYCREVSDEIRRSKICKFEGGE